LNRSETAKKNQLGQKENKKFGDESM